MPETLLRHWQMLRLLPRTPGRKVTTEELRLALLERGFHVERRTVQRDLLDLAGCFPIGCESSSRPYGWFWQRDAEPFDIPGMDVDTALAFRLAEDLLSRLLPATSRAHLDPHFRQARSVLTKAGGKRLAAWADCVRAISSGLALQPPVIVPAVLEAVHQSLLAGQRLEVAYLPLAADKPRPYELHPLGLVYRDSVAYLVATAWDYQDVRQYALHRMSRAVVLAQEARVPPGFQLEAYVHGLAFDYLLGEAPLLLVAALAPFLARKLAETPLAADQRLALLPDGRTQLAATVADTVQLRLWILSQAGDLEVLQPASLRGEIAERLRGAADRYALDHEPVPPRAAPDADREPPGPSPSAS